MKKLFIEAKASIDIKLPSREMRKLPKRVGLVTTIQHLHKLKDVKKQINDSVIGGQVLGCNAGNADRIKGKVDAFLYIGSGQFHPIEVAMKTGKDVFAYNPFTKKMKKLDKKLIKDYEGRKRGALIKFLSSKNIGILVSTKTGQMDMKRALKLKKKGDKTDKNHYLFAFDTLRFEELENFPFIQCWVNTACPRIADEKKGIINITDIPEL